MAAPSVGLPNMPKTPHWFQAEAVQSLYDYFEHKSGNPLILLPTGTGKSFVIALWICSVLQQWQGQRIAVLTHVHTLIQQNYDELIEMWPLAPAGICSAGLGKFDSALPIVFGGVQSVVSRVPLLGWRDLVLIDEAHLLSPKAETMYQKVIKELLEINPHLKVVGLSASGWRLGQGRLVEDGIFTDVAYDMCSYTKFNLLLEQGFLCPLIPKRTGTEYDLSNVKIDGYKYNERELDAATNQDALNIAVSREMCELAYDRKSWLVFCASIDHAENINNILRQLGIDSDVAHSKRGSKHNDDVIKRWKAGELRVAVNKDMLTTGVNNPRCDFIGVLRGLVSSALWVQMLGRGTRVAPFKSNCLAADFAGNTKRLGPINDPMIPQKRGVRKGSVPVRICDRCGIYNHASARVCIGCGLEFPFNSRLVEEASEAALIRSDTPEIVSYLVHHVVYRKHEKVSSPPSLRIDYHVGAKGFQKFSDWISIEHPERIVRKRARDWWRGRQKDWLASPPESTAEALARTEELRLPQQILVQVNSKYPKVTEVKF